MSMEFTYAAYEALLTKLQTKGYRFAGYHDCDAFSKCVVLRHDVDLSPEKALRMAEIEQFIGGGGGNSTYFFLLSTSFYNIADADSLRVIRAIHEMGHEIGLHFDEKKYLTKGAEADERIRDHVAGEAAIMERITGVKIRTVSMHRPSKALLSGDVAFAGGLVNAYGEKFTRGFKYLSDSRRHWREDVNEIVENETFDRLHILTHPFWYNQNARGMKDDLLDFLGRAAGERYEALRDNFRDLDAVFSKSDVANLLKGGGETR